MASPRSRSFGQALIGEEPVGQGAANLVVESAHSLGADIGDIGVGARRHGLLILPSDHLVSTSH